MAAEAPAKVLALFLLFLVALPPAQADDFLEEDDEPWWNQSLSASPRPLSVAITLIRSAAASGAVCLDGSLPAYHLHRGYGSGANSWLVQIEGGGWCNDRRSCASRKSSRRGSSKHMEKWLTFTGILSNKPKENPDFYNWNRVKLRYCDGASFTGDEYGSVGGLHFRGQRIWSAAMEELMSQGMRSAKQALLSGCSAGALSSILHCDEFQELFRGGTVVKCLADAGMFLDAADVAGGHTLRSFYHGVVRLQGSGKNLPRACTSRMDATSCFFPQNVISSIRTALFVLNTAYDVWQIQQSLAPRRADPPGAWTRCKRNYGHCNANQLHFLQGFRNQMLDVLRDFSMSNENGLFINSCFAHCQSERPDTWFADDSPRIGGKRVAEAVGDWFFGRDAAKEIDCAYPCDGTCHHLVFDAEDQSLNSSSSSIQD